ncbi:endolytic transglycosylase MltG [Xylanimonas oleitrophica]|uniref:Endolytic murein transglycosylase n=1 Tax=Xylanimonas oleitrophica TaxID=2607479 RepID=A0A2W5WNL4_9MICO|nr:endolytic transglycosylase MltG [Xylanimonas oleitrophica]PZR52750.1 endolytic transglycosylase MltG [Xylanimonas oleitrophica]
MTDLFEHPAVQPQPVPGGRRSAARARAAAKRRRRRRRRAVIVVVACLALVSAVAWASWDRVSGLVSNPFSNQAQDYPGPGGDPVEVVIPAGATGTRMGHVLVESDVVASVGAFTSAFSQNPQASQIQPGTYQLLTQMRASDAVAALVKNERIETRVTIPEGFTAEQVLERVASVTTITRDELDAAIADPASIGLPAEAQGNVEGWLFPATYTVQPGDDATSLLSAMVARTVAELDGLGVAPDQREIVLNKASLVEREAKYAPDRPKMARAIENRLERGQRLEIDAAVAYGLGKSGTALTRADTQDPDNPYNTYRHGGLPPTPIANPGAASVEAVVNPAEGDWLFWVAVNLDTGETKFATTYEEHLQYVAELRRWQAENGG